MGYRVAGFRIEVARGYSWGFGGSTVRIHQRAIWLASTSGLEDPVGTIRSARLRYMGSRIWSTEAISSTTPKLVRGGRPGPWVWSARRRFTRTSTGHSSQTILPVLRRMAWFAGSRIAPPPSETTCRVDLATARIVSLSIWRKFASPARAKKEEIGSLRDSSIWWSVSTQSNPRAEARKGAMEVFPLPRYPIR